jgi:hypothetical protein
MVGNTGIRRKTNAGIKLVADATLEGSDRLLASLKEINETAKEMKREEMYLDLRIHEDNMEYKMKRNQQVLENARLTLINQGAVVAAIAGLADAIRGMLGAPSAGPSLAPTSDEPAVSASSAP